MTVFAEKSEEFVFELGELGLARKASIPLHIVVQKMDRFRLEKISNLFVFVNDISEMYFIDFGVNSLISDPGPEEHQGKDCETLKSEGEIPELIKEE